MTDGYNGIIGGSSLDSVFYVMKKAAPVNSTVLVCGESGTGKELVARGIHKQSPRSENPFVTVKNLPELDGKLNEAFTDSQIKRLKVYLSEMLFS